VSNISVVFENPWWLVLLFPGIFLALFPFFRLKRKYRRNANRIASLCLHLAIVLMLTSLTAGFTVRVESVSIKNDVLLVVDTSESTEPAKNKIDNFIRQTIAQSGEAYRIGIVAFAAEPTYAVKLTANTRRVFSDYESASKPRGGASNIEQALNFAKEQLSIPQNSRVILISDGLETDGAGRAAAGALAADGIRLDTVFFPSGTSDREVKIVSVEVPPRIGLGVSATVSVTVQSAAAGNARLQLFANDALYSERPIGLSGATDSYASSYVPHAPGLHALRVKIVAENDQILQNNEYWTFISIEDDDPKILLLESVPGEAEKLRSLYDARFTVDVKNILDAPAAIGGLQSYDEVVLVNVANADMPEGFDALLSAYVGVYGGGLFTAGGSRAYRQEDMQDTLYEGMLPVNITETVDPSVGLMVMIDTSSSMYRENVNPAYMGENRLERGKQAARDIINTYSRDKDYIGLMQFDGRAMVRSQMVPATQKQALLAAVDQITGGSGSVYTDALLEAESMLIAFDRTDIKHILFVSDGDVQNDSRYNDVVSRIASRGIRLSVLGIGSGGSANTAALTEVAARGEGTYIHADQQASQSEVSGNARAILDAVRGSSDDIGSFTPYIYRNTQALQGIAKLPDAGGYYGARAKNPGDVVLSVAAGGDPFYVEWAYGTGRVGSLLCDLSGVWSEKYFTDPMGVLFLENIAAKCLFPSIPLRNRDITAVFTPQNLISHVSIETESAVGDRIQAMLGAPDGGRESVTLTQQSQNTYSAEIKTELPGVYALELIKTDRNGNLLSQTTAYTAFSYSQEYAGFADTAACAGFMADIAQSGNGRVLYPTDRLFGTTAESVTEMYDPRILFLSLSIVLFLLDIVFRKFKLKRKQRSGQI
jgi:Mg-chelatase subunit ChlD